MGHSGAFKGTLMVGYGYTGPWKGGRAAGRARRGERVIVSSENRVHVNLSEDPMFVKVFMGSFSIGERQNLLACMIKNAIIYVYEYEEE